MAEIAAGFLGPALQVVKWIGAPIMRQFNYLCCFTSNITALKLEAEKLDDAEGDLQGQVDRATDDVQIIAREVDTWLKTSKDIKRLKNTILDEVPNVESGCLKLRARFSLSKRAKKTTDRIIQHRGQCKFDAIAQPRPPAAAEAVPLGMTTYDFKSRKQIEEDIMTSLRDGDVNMMGICGMGGLGKTTMAKIIMNRALKEHLFDEAVIAVISQQAAGGSKIQDQIGGSLGLKLEGETWQTRVQKLRARLSGTKRTLLVLDDIWERLELEEFGIPLGCKGCTILLTSRNHDVLNAMNVEKVFGMKVLPKEDAWFLFRERAGTCVDDFGLNSIAKEVVEECRGLPIALSTVGVALKDEKNRGIWKDAVRQLRKASPNNIPDFIKEVYNPLKVSYDKLESQEAKSIFLLCCLFGEDADIPIDKLTYFCIGLGIFEEGISDLEQARNRMSALIKRLKSRSLLLNGDKEDHVKMHDVIRDVCIFISKEKGYINGNDCTWISSSQTTVGERTKLPKNLHLLFLNGNYSKQEVEINKFDNSFVEWIRDLQVLCIEHYTSLTSMQHTTGSLRNLRTLVIYSCWNLETISFVGELVNLEILVCQDCYSIMELPPEMKRLHRLKLLDLTGCGNLERIGRGIISSLVGLEELKMYGSFTKWEAARDSNERGNGNATVRELEALTNLRCLEIQIDDHALAVENMHLSSKLDIFRIKIGLQFTYLLPYSFNKTMSLKWEGETSAGEWIEKQLIRDAECLHLTGNGANNVDYLATSQNIRWLDFEVCTAIKNIGRTSMDDATVFAFIEHMKLYYLPQLEEIVHGPISSDSFQNLKELNLIDLPALKQLWKSSSTSPVFHNLSSIHIANCPKLEKILDGPISPNSFHNLKQLGLQKLPALRKLWENSSSSPAFHNLSSICIADCPKLEEILDGPISSNSLNDLEYFPALKQLRKRSSSPVFDNLSFIQIVGCRCLRNVCQLSSIAENNCLSQLQTLDIQDCEMMEQVFLWKDNEECEWRTKNIMLPKLEKVRLYKLPNLVTLCQGIGSIEFPLLTEMSIDKCPKMKSMVSSEENNCRGSRNADIDDNHSPHLFRRPQNVSFSFNQLEKLRISSYKGSMILFSSSIARNFVSLIKLEISFCVEMVKVIEDEKEEENEVSGGGAQTTTTILFSKLQKLRLISLETLESFCEWKFGVELPSLRKVFIDECPNMKSFTRGPLITPDLESVKINCKKLESGEKDLNGALKQHYLARQKEKQKEEQAQDEEEVDEDEKKEEVEEKQRKTTTDEDEETNSEIEEEQNSQTTNPAVEEEERRVK